MRRLAMVAALLMLPAAQPATAQSGEEQSIARCTVPAMMDLGPMRPDQVPMRFARISGGTVTVGSAQRVTVRVTGCDAAARYTLGFADRYVARNGARQVALVAVVTAVNGIALPSPMMMSGGNAIPLDGNPELELVFATDVTDLSAAFADGTYRGNTIAIFQKR